MRDNIYTYLLVFVLFVSVAVAEIVEEDVDFMDLDFIFQDDDINSIHDNGTSVIPKHQEMVKILPILTVHSHKKKKVRACNSDTLQKIMKENIQDNPRASKRAIYHAAFEVLSVGLNVICARCSFSFLAKTTLYCQEAVKDITCFAYNDK